MSTFSNTGSSNLPWDTDPLPAFNLPDYLLSAYDARLPVYLDPETETWLEYIPSYATVALIFPYDALDIGTASLLP